MAGAAGATRRASRAELLAFLLLAAAACLVSCDDRGVELDDKGGELPPRRFPSGPNLEKLRLRGNETRPQGPPVAVLAASSASSALNRTVAAASTAPSAASAAPSAAAATPPTTATPRPFLEPTKSAAVLIGVFVCLALAGYFALLVWRRVLERKYGNREILVNEEQFEQDSDLRNFQL